MLWDLNHDHNTPDMNDPIKTDPTLIELFENELSADRPATSIAPSSFRPELPDWGVYLRWPTAGQSWIHTADLAAALKLIPSRRIFQRTRWDNTFYQLHYGAISIRVRPTMWVRVENLDLSVGQQVELLSHHGENEAGVFTISDMLFSPQKQQVEFYLRRRDMTLPKSFTRKDLRPLVVRYQLRTGYFQHQTPTARLPADLDLLNVGDLTDE